MIGTFKSIVRRVLPSRWGGRLHAWNTRRGIRSYNAHVVEHRYGSGTFKVMLADALGQGWYDNDWNELPEITELRKIKLIPGSQVFDFGAHQGVVAMMFAREVGVSGNVIVVESSRRNADIAAQNATLNGFATIEVVHAAVADKVGTIVFNESLNGQIDDGSGSFGQVVVPSVTVDSLMEKYGQPDVVILDIEGAECMALSAAGSALASDVDFFVEVHVGHGLEKLGGSVEKVLSYFPADQYSRLGRAEADTAFRPLTANDPLFLDRFFLIARRHK